jgi:hypothetical protein
MNVKVINIFSLADMMKGPQQMTHSTLNLVPNFNLCYQENMRRNAFELTLLN